MDAPLEESLEPKVRASMLHSPGRLPAAAPVFQQLPAALKVLMDSAWTSRPVPLLLHYCAVSGPSGAGDPQCEVCRFPYQCLEIRLELGEGK